MADEQDIEVREWTDDLGLNHEVKEDDPQREATLDERLRQELPDRLHRPPREEYQLTEPDEGARPDTENEAIGQDYDAERKDLPAEERALRIDPDEDLT
ncbi:MAG: hypothetical protein HOY71_30215 [Nonomuraea sp.]|nr:hypothetical protein [Nonomuraea sp.]NUR88384.1 hypothetical protein [Nonomuraea sp.]NUT42103.1 hypothetical protein [Thermoactinospora sp.]